MNSHALKLRPKFLLKMNNRKRPCCWVYHHPPDHTYACTCAYTHTQTHTHFLVTVIGRRGASGISLGLDRECCWMSFNAHGTPHSRLWTLPSVNGAEIGKPWAMWMEQVGRCITVSEVTGCHSVPRSLAPGHYCTLWNKWCLCKQVTANSRAKQSMAQGMGVPGVQMAEAGRVGLQESSQEEGAAGREEQMAFPACTFKFCLRCLLKQIWKMF